MPKSAGVCVEFTVPDGNEAVAEEIRLIIETALKASLYRFAISMMTTPDVYWFEEEHPTFLVP